MNEPEIRKQILEACKELIQTKGYHCFTVNEIAQLVETSQSNIYHHFGNKENLVKETVIKYKEDFHNLLKQIEEKEKLLKQRLEKLINAYASVLDPDNTKICLCMSLIVEVNTLPESIKEELIKFFDLQVDWIIKMFQETDNYSTILNYQAEMLISGLEGIIAIARLKGGSEYFKNLAYSLLDNFIIAHQRR